MHSAAAPRKAHAHAMGRSYSWFVGIGGLQRPVYVEKPNASQVGRQYDYGGQSHLEDRKVQSRCAEDHCQSGGRQSHARQKFVLWSEGAEETSNPKGKGYCGHEEHVDHVRAEYVAYCQSGLVPPGSRYVGNQLGHGRGSGQKHGAHPQLAPPFPVSYFVRRTWPAQTRWQLQPQRWAKKMSRAMARSLMSGRYYNSLSEWQRYRVV